MLKITNKQTKAPNTTKHKATHTQLCITGGRRKKHTAENIIENERKAMKHNDRKQQQ